MEIKKLEWSPLEATAMFVSKIDQKIEVYWPNSKSPTTIELEAGKPTWASMNFRK